MRQHFSTEQWLPFPLPVVFSFFANPANLPPLMPHWQHARIEEATVVSPGAPPQGTRVPGGVYAGSGTELLITARVAPGLPVRAPWLARIEDFRWVQSFCDVQLKGPFAYWRHCHSVVSDQRNHRYGTRVHDEVTYELPLAEASRPAQPLAASLMRSLFAYRQKQATTLIAEHARKLGVK